MKTTYNLVKCIVIIITCFVCSVQASAQNNLQKAQDMMAVYEYPKAIDMYNSHFKAHAPGITDLRNLAECYININDTKSAMESMSKVVMMDNATPLDVLTYAALLKSEGNYPEAIIQYQRYKVMVPQEGQKTDMQISSCEMAAEWIAHPEYIDVFNMNDLNSENSDFGLVPVDKGYLLTSDRKYGATVHTPGEIYGWTGKPYLKLYYVPVDDKNMPTGAIEPVSELNYKYHNGPGIFDTKDNMIYFTRTKMVRVKKKPINPDPTSWYDHSTAADYTNRLEIYSAKYKNGKWFEEKAFMYNNADDYSVGHPAISPDGTIMYFVSDMPGGYGESDIYYSMKRADNEWSQPQNAGSIINSPGKEVFPYVDAEGTLFFSSDGHPGMGGLDIFTSKGSRDDWSAPENLKAPLNSPKDDFSIYYTETGKAGYFSSNRYGGNGSDDLYSFVASPPVNLILAIATKERFDDNTTGVLTGVNLEITSTSENNLLPFISGAPGTYYATAKCKDEYELMGMRDGYFSSSLTTKMPECITKQDTVFVDLLFTKIIINKPIVLRNIYYDFDKWNIRPDAAIELDKLVKILVDNPEISIELGSHTDCRGSDKYNEKLSQKRAESAVNYIVSMGIDKKRITAKGYGEYVLINKCSNGVECTEEEHQMNRRTEFKVTSYKGQVSINN